MIDVSEIKAERRTVNAPSGEMAREFVEARLLLNACYHINPGTADEGELAFAERYVRAMLWQRLYGDLVPLLGELTAVVRYMDPSSAAAVRARELVSSLNEKIRRP